MLRRGFCLILVRWRAGSVHRGGRFFNMRPCLLEAFHFLPLLMDLPLGVCAIRSNASMCRWPIFLPNWMGCALLSLATSTLATTCLLARLRAPLTWLTICNPTFLLLRETLSRAKAIRWTPALLN